VPANGQGTLKDHLEESNSFTVHRVWSNGVHGEALTFWPTRKERHRLTPGPPQRSLRDLPEHADNRGF
jgi:hypothetical protein